MTSDLVASEELCLFNGGNIRRSDARLLQVIQVTLNQLSPNTGAQSHTKQIVRDFARNIIEEFSNMSRSESIRELPKPRMSLEKLRNKHSIEDLPWKEEATFENLEAQFMNKIIDSKGSYLTPRKLLNYIAILESEIKTLDGIILNEEMTQYHAAEGRIYTEIPF